MKKIPFALTLCILFFAPTVRGVDFVHMSEIFYNTPLNEVITAPPFSNGEFIEFFNAGDHAVDMEGWVVRGDGVTKVFTFGQVIIPPQSFLILAYRHSWTPDFELSHLFTDLDKSSGQIVYQNRIILTNNREFIRLYDPSGLLRDSIYYGNVTSIQPISARLVATNANGAPINECRSVQRKVVEFDERGVAAGNHLHWYVDIARPFSHSPFYTQPDIPAPPVLGNQIVSFAHDAAGNRTARTIILQPFSTSAAPLIDDYNWWAENPFSDIINEFRVNIHPNPTRGRLMVEIDMEGREIESIELIVAAPSGMLIFRKQTTSALIPVDLQGAPIGTYTLYIIINGQSQHYNIVKL